MQLGVLRAIRVDLKLSKMKSGTRSSRIQNYQNALEANAEQIAATLYSTLKGNNAPDFDEKGQARSQRNNARDLRSNFYPKRSDAPPDFYI